MALSLSNISQNSVSSRDRLQEEIDAKSPADAPQRAFLTVTHPNDHAATRLVIATQLAWPHLINSIVTEYNKNVSTKVAT